MHTLSSDQRASFYQTLEHLSHKYEALIGTDVISQAEEMITLHALEQNKSRRILIGLNADLSWQSALAGLAIKQGAQLAIHEVNQAGGVLGRELELITKDHQNLPARGRNNVRFFAGIENLVAILGGKRSPVIIEELDLIQQFGIPYLIPWAAAEQLTTITDHPNFVFRLSLNDRYVGPFLADAALRRNEALAIVFEDTTWGRGNHQAITQYAEKMGKSLVGAFSFSMGTKSIDEIVGRVAAAKAKSLILVASPKESKQFLKKLYEVLPAIPVISHWGLLGNGIYLDSKYVFFMLHT